MSGKKTNKIYNGDDGLMSSKKCLCVLYKVQFDILYNTSMALCFRKKNNNNKKKKRPRRKINSRKTSRVDIYTSVCLSLFF